MREIKFRAWHKNSKHMCYHGVTTDLLNRDYLEFMQYTGIKDKNGREIFEGDIVNRTSMSPGGMDFRGHVEYDEGTYWLVGILEQYEGIELFSEIDELEVIGNIYESPELLEGCSCSEKDCENCKQEFSSNL